MGRVRGTTKTRNFETQEVYNMRRHVGYDLVESDQ